MFTKPLEAGAARAFAFAPAFGGGGFAGGGFGGGGKPLPPFGVFNAVVLPFPAAPPFSAAPFCAGGTPLPFASVASTRGVKAGLPFVLAQVDVHTDATAEVINGVLFAVS